MIGDNDPRGIDAVERQRRGSDRHAKTVASSTAGPGVIVIFRGLGGRFPYS